PLAPAKSFALNLSPEKHSGIIPLKASAPASPPLLPLNLQRTATHLPTPRNTAAISRQATEPRQPSSDPADQRLPISFRLQARRANILVDEDWEFSGVGRFAFPRDHQPPPEE